MAFADPRYCIAAFPAFSVPKKEGGKPEIHLVLHIKCLQEQQLR